MLAENVFISEDERIERDIEGVLQWKKLDRNSNPKLLASKTSSDGPFECLPKFVLFKIFKMLEFQEYASIFCVCKKWSLMSDYFFQVLFTEVCRERASIFWGYQEKPSIFSHLSFSEILQTKIPIKKRKSTGKRLSSFSTSVDFFYEGEFDEDFSGVGICYYRKSRYEGDFWFTSREGTGKYWWKNGELTFFSPTSFFQLISLAGDFYEGKFQHNKRNGQGKFVWKSGNWYEGWLREISFLHFKLIQFFLMQESGRTTRETATESTFGPTETLTRELSWPTRGMGRGNLCGLTGTSTKVSICSHLFTSNFKFHFFRRVC